MYGEMRRSGVPVKVAAQRKKAMASRDFEEATGEDTRLVEVFIVSSLTGFQRGLKSL